MKHDEIVKAIQYIYPNGSIFTLNETDLEWLDTEQTQPTQAEIEQGWIDYQAKVAADKAEAQAKREAALAKLQALGLDTDDLKALGL
jgi:hypothetical protein